MNETRSSGVICPTCMGNDVNNPMGEMAFEFRAISVKTAIMDKELRRPQNVCNTAATV